MTTTQRQHPIGSGFSAATTTAEVMAGIDLTGRTAVVTGGYSGLGLATTRGLVAAGARVTVPARRPDVARSALADLREVEVVPDVDFADLGSVASGAARIAELADSIDVLVLAAGVMATPSRPVGPGWDYQFTVNHLGPFALTMRLFPLLAATGARVVAFSSGGHRRSDIRWDDLHFRRGYNRWLAYSQSKTANILFAARLDELGRDHGVKAFSVHPGKIITELQRELTRDEQVELGWVDAEGNVVGEGFKTADQGAATGLWAATSPALRDIGGLYLEDCEVAPLIEPGSDEEGGVQPYALDPDSAVRLWELSAAMTATDLP